MFNFKKLMMNLVCTTIIDPSQHNAEFFHDLVNGNEIGPIVPFIVIGDELESQKFLKLADQRAGRFPKRIFAWHNIWLRSRTFLRNECDLYLQNFPSYHPDQYDDILAFTIGPRSHQTKDIIYRGKRSGPSVIKGAFTAAFSEIKQGIS